MNARYESNTPAAAQRRTEEVFTAEHELFRETVRRFIAREIEPYYLDWEKNERGVPKELWKKAGALGLLGTSIPEAYDGVGGDPLYTMIHAEELGHSLAGASVGGVFENDMLTETLIRFGSEAQKREWFPRILSGDAAQAFALTEPDAGSDIFNLRTRARRVGDDYLISGQKIYISNGLDADLIYLIARTDQDIEGPRHAMTMFIIDPSAVTGLERRRMDTLGVKAQAIAELFFDEIRVPASAMIGEEGAAMTKLMPSFFPFDRALSAMRALAAAELAFDVTVDYTKNREVFGRHVIDFQNTQFKLAEMKATLIVGRSFLKDVLRKLMRRELDDATASTAKYWFSDNAFKIATQCLQLHGGYGYMNESPISRLFTFTRLGSIYAGTSEIQKRIIARSFM